MRSMFLAFAAIALITVLAGIALPELGLSTRDVTSAPSVRLD